MERDRRSEGGVRLSALAAIDKFYSACSGFEVEVNYIGRDDCWYEEVHHRDGEYIGFSRKGLEPRVLRNGTIVLQFDRHNNCIGRLVFDLEHLARALGPGDEILFDERAKAARRPKPSR